MGERQVTVSLLLDTHILVWWQTNQGRLSRAQEQALSEAATQGLPLAISGVTLWEAALLVHRGRLEIDSSLSQWLQEVENHPQIRVLPITADIAAESVRLGDDFPKDPADRIIVATARCHGLRLVTADDRIRRWGKTPLV